MHTKFSTTKITSILVIAVLASAFSECVVLGNLLHFNFLTDTYKPNHYQNITSPWQVLLDVFIVFLNIKMKTKGPCWFDFIKFSKCPAVVMTSKKCN